jgi:hypothetical protein
MKTLSLFLLALTLAPLAAQAEEACKEETLVRFVSAGKDVSSNANGLEECGDYFGGNEVFTPGNDLRIYVNFNIPGTIDLDEVDAAYELMPENTPIYVRKWMNSIQLIVVKDARLYQNHPAELGRDAFMDVTGTYLFISERVVKEGRFGALMREFYGAIKTN